MSDSVYTTVNVRPSRVLTLEADEISSQTQRPKLVTLGLDEEYSSRSQALWAILWGGGGNPYLRNTECSNQTNTKLLTPFYRIALTSLPKMSLRSWMRIQPNLQPGTSQRLANPPQDRMGTLVLRVARGSYLPSENTWGKEELLNVLDLEPSIPLLRRRGTEKRIVRPLPTLRHDWIPRGSGKFIQRQFGVWSGLRET